MLSRPCQFKHLREVSNALYAEFGHNATASQAGGSPFPTPSLSHDAPRSSTLKNVKASPRPLGCVPFLGLFLRDLTLNAELPTYLDPTSPHTPAAVSADGELLAVADETVFAHLGAGAGAARDVTLRPLVNVHKFRVRAALVQKALGFVVFAEGYPYEPDVGCYFKCLKIRCLEGGVLRECSARIE